MPLINTRNAHLKQIADPRLTRKAEIKVYKRLNKQEIAIMVNCEISKLNQMIIFNFL